MDLDIPTVIRRLDAPSRFYIGETVCVRLAGLA